MIKTARQLKDLIRNLSKDKSADAQILMRNYMMERFLERISLSEYRDKFILKGGMLVAAMVGLDARSTMDIDATVKGATVGIEEVENMIALQSYISTLMTMSLAMGLVFEIPILSWLFAKLGFLSADFMRKYRKHAIVVILVVAAIITPTSDVFTLSLVSLPIWISYETSILLVSKIHN